MATIFKHNGKDLIKFKDRFGVEITAHFEVGRELLKEVFEARKKEQKKKSQKWDENFEQFVRR